MVFSSILLYISLFVALFFEVFLLITYFEIRENIELESKNSGQNIKNFPSVSIIVPCYNEEKSVVATVKSLLGLEYPKDKLKILIIDDGSTDKTREIVEKSFSQNKQIKIFEKENGGKHTALNFALEKIDTELVGSLDADSFVDKEALRKIIPYFEKEDVMAVTASIKIHKPESIIQRIQWTEYNWSILLRKLLSSMNALYVTPGPFSIFRAKVFKEIGEYKKAHYTEDMEMALRMHKNGYKITNAHSAYVYTIGPEKVRGLYKQRVRWVYGFLNNVIDYKEMFFSRKHGHIGMFILPIATFSIFSTIYAAGNLLWSITNKTLEQLIKHEAIGWNFGMPNFSNVNWFAINLSTTFWLTLIIFFLTLFILFISLRMANGKFKFSRNIIFYLTIYIFIVPLWLTKAAYSTIVRKNISWR